MIKKYLSRLLRRIGLLPYAKYWWSSVKRLWYGSPFFGLPEARVLEDFVDELSDDDCVYDIGAGHGEYSFWALMTSQAEVHSFEPDPRCHELLRSYTKPGRARFELHPVALSNRPGNANFHLGDNIATSSLAGEGRSVEVQQIRAETVLEDTQHPNIVKIDVEGAEYDVVRGFGKMIPSSIRAIYCEIHTDPGEQNLPTIYDYGSSPQELESYLETNGFRISKIMERDRDYHIKAKRVN